MRQLSDFYRQILPYAPSVPTPLMDSQIVLAAIELCERTRCWREVDTFRTDGEDIICTPTDAALMEIEEAWFDGHKLDRVPFKDVMPHAWPRDCQIAVEGFQPVCISQASYNSVVIAPKSKGELRISMFLKPTIDARSMPDVIYDLCFSAVSAGAASKILIIPGQPYTNPQLGGIKAQEFNSFCDRNFNLNIRGQQRAATRTKGSWL